MNTCGNVTVNDDNVHLFFFGKVSCQTLTFPTTSFGWKCPAALATATAPWRQCRWIPNLSSTILLVGCYAGWWLDSCKIRETRLFKHAHLHTRIYREIYETTREVVITTKNTMSMSYYRKNNSISHYRTLHNRGSGRRIFLGGANWGCSPFPPGLLYVHLAAPQCGYHLIVLKLPNLRWKSELKHVETLVNATGRERDLLS